MVQTLRGTRTISVFESAPVRTALYGPFSRRLGNRSLIGGMIRVLFTLGARSHHKRLKSACQAKKWHFLLEHQNIRSALGRVRLRENPWEGICGGPEGQNRV